MLGAGRLRRSGGVKDDPRCTRGGHRKYGKMDEDDVLTKSRERDAGASDRRLEGSGAAETCRW